MRRIFVDAEQMTGAACKLGKDDAHYLIEVLRLQPGDVLQTFDGQGNVRDARIARVEAGQVVLSLGEKRALPASGCEVILLQGLCKGEKMDLVVQKATELGASRIVPVACGRSVVKLDGPRAEARVVRWRRVAEEAARQCGRADVPLLDPVRPFGEAVVSLAGDGGAALKLCCDEGERERTLRAALAGAPGARRFMVAVGPEGGLLREEIAAAAGAGFLPVTLGPRVLRTETVALAVLAILQHVAGDLG